MHFLVELKENKPFVELIEDEESDSNSEKPPSKKKKCPLQKKFPFASLRVVGRCLYLSKCVCNFQYLLIVAFLFCC